MKINDVLRAENIKVFLEGTDKAGIIRELVELALPSRSEDDRAEAIRALMEREKVVSTGIGEGVAIPHARVGSLEGLIAACGLSRQPVDFEALDGRPVRLFFLVLCPEERTGLLLRYLAKISRLLYCDREFKENLFSCETAEEMFQMFRRQDSRHSD